MAVLEMWLLAPLMVTVPSGASKVTPSAASQSLRVLHENGLVDRARSGREVLYRRTPDGDRLVRGHRD